MNARHRIPSFLKKPSARVFSGQGSALQTLIIAALCAVLCVLIVPARTASAQDLEALLTEIALGNRTAAHDLRGVQARILPKLLDYAQNKGDQFMAYMARY